jgi:hypothetical protein
MLVIPLAQRQSVLVDANIYQDKVTWEHPRDLGVGAEMEGNSSYGITGGYTSLGLYELMASETTIDTVRLKAKCSNASRELTLRLYQRNTNEGFSLALPYLYQGTIPAGTLSSSGYAAVDLHLDHQVVCPAGKYLFVVLTSSSANELGMATWTSDSGSAPFRHGMKVSTDGTTMGETQVAGYAATTFKLSANLNLTHSLATAWTHPREDAELYGDKGWAVLTVAPGVAFKEQMTAATHFDRVRLAAAFQYYYLTNNQVVDLYVYVRNDSNNFVPANATPSAHVHYSKGEFPTENAIHTFMLGETVSAAAGQWVWIVFFLPNAESGQTLLTFRLFNAAGSNPARTGYTILTSLSATTAITSTYGYTTSFQLLGTIPTPVDLATIMNNFPSDAVKFDAGTTSMTATNVNAAIKEAYNRSASGIAPRIVLPDEIVAVVGDTLQLFKRGLIETWDVYSTPHELLCDFGSSFPRYYETTPTAAGDHTLRVNVIDIEGTPLQTDTVNIKVVEATGAPAAEKRVLCVGDSLTEGGEWPKEMYRRLTQSGGTPTGLGYGNITFVGDKLMTTYVSPQQYFMGSGGAMWEDYVNQGATSVASNVTAAGHGKTSADLWTIYTDSNAHSWKLARINGDVIKFVPTGHTSAMPAAPASLTLSGHATINYTVVATTPWTPFWDSTGNALSFSAFSTNYLADAVPDIVYVLLGWNSGSVKTADNAEITDHSSLIGLATTFVNQLHTDWPSTQVRLFGVQIPSMHGYYSATLGASDRANWYRMLRSVNGLNLAYQDLANQSAYSGFVKFLNLSCQFDSEYNMPEADAYVNSRNSTVTEKHGTNTVHPAGAGYYQIADVAYRDFIRSFCST